MYFGAWWGEADGEWWGDVEGVADQAGFTSLLGLWVGGASAITVIASQAGVRSLLARWLGGGASLDDVPLDPLALETSGGHMAPSVRRRVRQWLQPPRIAIDAEVEAIDEEERELEELLCAGAL